MEIKNQIFLEELKELAVEANVHDRLVFAGHIKDVVKAMAACDIVAHCSTAPEPFGSVITEAQLADRPVVVTKAGGALEIVLDHETGYLTPPGSVPDLVSAIEMILRSSEKTKIMVEKGKTRVLEKYSANKMIEDFKAILAQI